MEQSPSWEAVTQLVKKFPAFYGTRRFITVFIRPRSVPRPRVTFHNKMHFFYGEALLAPCPNPKLDDHPLSAVLDCFQYICSYTPHLEAVCSIRNPTASHGMVTGTYIKWTPSSSITWIYIGIYIYIYYVLLVLEGHWKLNKEFHNVYSSLNIK